MQQGGYEEFWEWFEKIWKSFEFEGDFLVWVREEMKKEEEQENDRNKGDDCGEDDGDGR